MNNVDQKHALLRKIARLQEFYDNERLHSFYHTCEKENVDVCAAYEMMDHAAMKSVRRVGEAPEFDGLVQSVVKTLKTHKLLTFLN